MKIEKRKLQRAVKSVGSARRARMLVQEGVLSKAAKCLTSAPADLCVEQQKYWAEKFLPRSINSDRALDVFAAVMPEFDGDGVECHQRPVMKGIRFSSLSAPGPSGARPEYLKEALHTREGKLFRSYYLRLVS